MNYDPANYDVLFVLVGSRQALDVNAVAAAVRGSLEPWYAFPFPSAQAVDMPQWVLESGDENADGGAVYTARTGLLATDLGGGIGKFPFGSQWAYVTGIRWVVQLRTPATALVTRRTAKSNLNAALASAITPSRGNIQVATLVPYAERTTSPTIEALNKLPFPSTPSLPGNEATYKSGAIFAVLAGIAVGGVLISAALQKD